MISMPEHLSATEVCMCFSTYIRCSLLLSGPYDARIPLHASELIMSMYHQRQGRVKLHPIMAHYRADNDWDDQMSSMHSCAGYGSVSSRSSTDCEV